MTSLMMTVGPVPASGSGSNEAYGEIRLQSGGCSATPSTADVDASSRFVRIHARRWGVAGVLGQLMLPKQTLVFGAWGVAGLDPSRDSQVVVRTQWATRLFRPRARGTQVWR